MLRKSFLGLILAAATGQFASAAPTIIDFATGSLATVAGGSISYAGGAGPLVGSGIKIGQVSVSNAPQNNGTYLVNGAIPCPITLFPLPNNTCGSLDFTTGNITSYSNGVYTFGAGGGLTITGSVPGVTGSVVLVNAPIISGTFNSNGSLQLTIVSGSDIKDPTLLAYFGLTSNTQFQFNGTIHATLNNIVANGGAFNATASGSTDIGNVVVPEPAAVLLLGTVLVGVTGLLRRKTSKA